MAEQQSWISRAAQRVANGLRNIGSNVSYAVQHPGQTAIRGGARLVGSVLGPAGSAVLGRIADHAVNRYQTGAMQDTANSLTQDTNNQLANQIFGNATG